MMICSNILFLRIIYYVKVILSILRFVVPIVLIIKLAISFYQNMFNPDDKNKILKEVFGKIIACLVIFFVPTMINLIVKLIENVMETSIDYQSCYESATLENIKYLEDLELKKASQEEQEKNQSGLANYNELVQKENELIKNNANENTSSDSDGVIIGQKYNLTESQLQDLAKICQREQNSARGAAAEASLMANRYELLSASSKYKNKGLHNYVLHCGWWAPANKGTYKSTNLKPEILNAVRNVLINGNRTLPLYIDEHDWRGDLKKIVTNGKSYYSRSDFNNNNNYIKNQTVIYNKMGAVYTFYQFPTEKSDPFGYTSSAKKKVDSLNS